MITFTEPAAQGPQGRARRAEGVGGQRRDDGLLAELKQGQFWHKKGVAEKREVAQVMADQ